MGALASSTCDPRRVDAVRAANPPNNRCHSPAAPESRAQTPHTPRTPKRPPAMSKEANPRCTPPRESSSDGGACSLAQSTAAVPTPRHAIYDIRHSLYSPPGQARHITFRRLMDDKLYSDVEHACPTPASQLINGQSIADVAATLQCGEPVLSFCEGQIR